MSAFKEELERRIKIVNDLSIQISLETMSCNDELRKVSDSMIDPQGQVLIINDLANTEELMKKLYNAISKHTKIYKQVQK